MYTFPICLTPAYTDIRQDSWEDDGVNCIDGNTNNYCHSNEDEDKNPALTLDYGKGVAIDRVVVFNRAHISYRRRIVGAQISIRDGGNQLLWSNSFTGVQDVYTFSKPNLARFIRIDAVKKTYQGGKSTPILNLAEVQAFDTSGFLLTPTTAALNSSYSHGRNCIDGNIDNFCHSDSDTDENPTLLIGYGTVVAIARVVVFNRNDDLRIRRRIVGARISVLNSRNQVMWSSTFDGAQDVFTFYPSEGTDVHTALERRLAPAFCPRWAKNNYNNLSEVEIGTRGMNRLRCLALGMKLCSGRFTLVNYDEAWKSCMCQVGSNLAHDPRTAMRSVTCPMRSVVYGASAADFEVVGTGGCQDEAGSHPDQYYIFAPGDTNTGDSTQTGYKTTSAAESSCADENMTAVSKEDCRTACLSLDSRFGEGTWTDGPGCFRVTSGTWKDNCHWNLNANAKRDKEFNRAVCAQARGAHCATLCDDYAPACVAYAYTNNASSVADGYCSLYGNGLDASVLSIAGFKVIRGNGTDHITRSGLATTCTRRIASSSNLPPRAPTTANTTSSTPEPFFRGDLKIMSTQRPTSAAGKGTDGSADLVPVIVGVIAAMFVVCLVGTWVLNRRRGRGSTHRVANQTAALRELLLQNVQAQFLLGYRQLIGINIGSFEEYQAQIAKLEVPASAITIEDELGKGNYGTVFRAQLKRRGHPKEVVAVKVPNPPGLGAGADLESLADQSTALLLEAFVMHGLRHPFIVSVVALAAHCQPVMLCLELMENGDLRSFLKACRPSLPNPKAAIDTLTIAKMAARLSSAMSFLEKNRVIHRDLAARNVLVGATVLDVKLGDLGAARNVKNKEEYTYIATTTHMPAKWMSLESLRDAKFSHKSDVFAFGVLLWEICSLGKIPWGAFGVADIVDALKNGERLQEQPTTPQTIYDLCLRCWEMNPPDRPSFAQINDELQILPAIVQNTSTGAFGAGSAMRSSTLGYEREVSSSAAVYDTEPSRGVTSGTAKHKVASPEGYVDFFDCPQTTNVLAPATGYVDETSFSFSTEVQGVHRPPFACLDPVINTPTSDLDVSATEQGDTTGSSAGQSTGPKRQSSVYLGFSNNDAAA